MSTQAIARMSSVWRIVTSILVVFGVSACAVSNTEVSVPATKPLFYRVGGSPLIEGVSRTTIKYVHSDEKIANYYVWDDEDKVQKRFSNILCMLVDGPCKVAVQGLNLSVAKEIDQKRFNMVAGYLKKALELYNVGPIERNQVLTRVSATRISLLPTRTQW